MSETKNLLENFQKNLNEVTLGQEKEEIFNLIKGYNPNAKKENYFKMTIEQMLNILDDYRNKKSKQQKEEPKKQKEETKQQEKSKVDLNPDYDTDESIASKTNSKKGLEYFNDLDESKEINDMIMEEMIDEYSNMCENAGLSIKEAIQQLNGYDCLNTGSFRNALEELREYLNS